MHESLESTSMRIALHVAQDSMRVERRRFEREMSITRTVACPFTTVNVGLIMSAHLPLNDHTNLEDNLGPVGSTAYAVYATFSPYRRRGSDRPARPLTVSSQPFLTRAAPPAGQSRRAVAVKCFLNMVSLCLRAGCFYSQT